MLHSLFFEILQNISAVFLGTLEEMKNLTKNKVVDSCTQTQFLPALSQIESLGPTQGKEMATVSIAQMDFFCCKVNS